MKGRLEKRRVRTLISIALLYVFVSIATSHGWIL